MPGASAAFVDQLGRPAFFCKTIAPLPLVAVAEVAQRTPPHARIPGGWLRERHVTPTGPTGFGLGTWLMKGSQADMSADRLGRGQRSRGR